MPRADFLQSSFAAGEVSPLMAGQPNASENLQGLAYSINGILGPQGQWQRRPGTLFKSLIEDGTGPYQMVAFQPFAGQGYVLVFTDQRCLAFRVDRDRSRAEASFEFQTPWAGHELQKLRWVQSGQTLFLCHPNHPPQQIGFTGSAFVLTALALVDGPYLATNLNDRHTLTVNGLAISAQGFAPFQASDVGRKIRVFSASDSRWYNGEIFAVSSASLAFATWDPLLPGSSTLSIAATPQWYFGAFWEGNFPACLALHDDRLVFANTAANPQSLWMSAASDFTNFAPTLADSQDVSAASAIFGTLNDAHLNEIFWLVAADYSLLAGTVEGVWRLYSAEGPLSAESLQARKLDATGASNVQPLSLGSTALYVDRSGMSLLALSRDGLSSDLRAVDLSQSAKHLFGYGIVEIAAEQRPELRLWARLVDGELLCLTHSADSQTIGWTRQSLAAGQSTARAKVAGLVIGTCPSENGLGTDQQAWFLVRRYKAGQWQASLEILSQGQDHFDEYWPGHFLDQGQLDRRLVPSNLISDLDHLEGETIAVRSAEGDLGEFVVEGGQVDLPDAYFDLSYGLPFVSEARMNDINLGSAGGVSLTKSRHVHDVNFRVFRSGKFEAGTAESEFGSPVLPDDGATAFWPASLPEPFEDQPFPRVFSGDLRFKRDEGGWARRTAVAWRAEGTFPLTILAVVLRISGGD